MLVWRVSEGSSSLKVVLSVVMEIILKIREGRVERVEGVLILLTADEVVVDVRVEHRKVYLLFHLRCRKGL